MSVRTVAFITAFSEINNVNPKLHQLNVYKEMLTYSIVNSYRQQWMNYWRRFRLGYVIHPLQEQDLSWVFLCLGRVDDFLFFDSLSAYYFLVI